MSAVAATGLCRRCARRGWLLARLGDSLDALADDPARLWPTLELEDRELIAALAGSEAERSELLERWEGWSSLNCVSVQRGVCDGGVWSRFRAACRHHCRYPARLRDDPLAPHALAVFDVNLERGWEELDERKVVAIAGAHTPSEYGARVACSLATELAAAGVTVAGSESGIGAAARAASLEAGGLALCVGSSGEERSDQRAAGSRERHLIEPVRDVQARRWSILAAERTLALIADLVVVVQAAEQQQLDLACAEVARSRGVPVAAVPGPVDSPASSASNSLLAGGARVVCDATEALDALFGIGVNATVACQSERVLATRTRHARARRRPTSSRRLGRIGSEKAHVACDGRQQAVLDLLAAGERTLGELDRELSGEGPAALAVTELELAGLAVRGDDGRYRAGHLH